MFPCFIQVVGALVQSLNVWYNFSLKQRQHQNNSQPMFPFSDIVKCLDLVKYFLTS